VSTVVRLDDAVVTAGRFPVLTGLTLTARAGECLVLEGPNGAGKTSALRLIGGLESLARGSGEVCGIDLRRGDRREIRRHCGWLGHEGSFYDDLTVRENLTFAARAGGFDLAGLATSVEAVGLSQRLDVRAALLSAGQRRRLGIAWLVMRRPSIWLLDEPIAALDTSARIFLQVILEDALAKGACVILSAHDNTMELRAPVSRLTIVGGRIEMGESS